jgi:hypothetical protein
MTLLQGKLILVLFLVGVLFLHVNNTRAQEAPVQETHETPFGTMIVYEIRRDNQPNLVCYGLVSELGNKLVGCELHD